MTQPPWGNPPNQPPHLPPPGPGGGGWSEPQRAGRPVGPPPGPGWAPGGSPPPLPPPVPPQQQPGPPQHRPQQAPQYGPPPAPSSSDRAAGSSGGRGLRWTLLGVLGIVLLGVGGLVGYLLGHRDTTDRLDRAEVASGVTHVLQSDYGLSNVSDMTCPDGMDVTANARYTCTFTVGSAHGSVEIVVQNKAGQYVVQAPKG